MQDKDQQKKDQGDKAMPQEENIRIVRMVGICSEMYRDLQFYQLPVQYNPSTSKFYLNPLLQSLAITHSIPFSQLFFLHPQTSLHTYIETYPLSKPVYLDYDMFLGSRMIFLYREIGGNKIRQKQIKKKKKEREIGEVFQKVQEWREVKKGKNRMTLEESARKIGIAKKTLDDYYRLIKQGKKYEFDFDKHWNNKMGILRNFIKQQRQKPKLAQKQQQQKKMSQCQQQGLIQQQVQYEMQYQIIGEQQFLPRISLRQESQNLPPIQFMNFQQLQSMSQNREAQIKQQQIEVIIGHTIRQASKGQLLMGKRQDSFQKQIQNESI